MKLRIIMKQPMLFLALASCLLYSCQENEINDASSRDNLQVQFFSTVGSNSHTRVNNSNWEIGDSIGIFMLGSKEENSYNNSLYRASDSLATSRFEVQDFNQTLYYPVDGSDVDFISYYPYRPDIQDINTPYPIQLIDQSNRANMDFLYSNNAQGINKGIAPSNLNLKFYHQLSNIMINLKSTTFDINLMTIFLKGMHTSASFDLSTGILGVGSDIQDIQVHPHSKGMSYEAIIIPTVVSENQPITLEFMLNNGTGSVVSYAIPNGTVFSAGKRYIYDIEFDPHSIRITGTVVTWDVEQGTGAGY